MTRGRKWIVLAFAAATFFTLRATMGPRHFRHHMGHCIGTTCTAQDAGEDHAYRP